MYSSPPPPPRSNGCLWATIVFLSLLLILLLVGSFLFNAVMTVGISSLGDLSSMEGITGTPKARHKFEESLEEPGKADSKDRIVRIDLEGIIMSGGGAEGLFSQGMPMVEKIKRSLEQAVKDDRVKAIVLRVNSPGGEVTASDIMYAAVKAAAKVKPVVVYMDSIAASGGYYISCGATQIVATETTLTASIGVIMESLSYHGLFDKVGLGMNTFTSGPLKDTLNGARPMRPEERDYIQGLVNGMYDRFLTVVAEGRHLQKEDLRKGIADGRVVSGADALKAKLVDKIGYVEDAYKLARELGKAPDAMVVKYSRSSGLFDLFGAEAESRSKVELQLPGPAMLPKLLPGQMYYLPETFAH
ncbi:MAG: Protease-4 [Verrucomicrobiaceae bacterium]|nr:Protease-4 [Verrucomicrobiaceae bacterium]